MFHQLGQLTKNYLSSLLTYYLKFLLKQLEYEVVNSVILFVIILFTSKSPLLTGVLSDLIFLTNPFFLNSNEIFPASRKVSIKFSTISFNINIGHLFF